MITAAILRRRLRQGKTYDDFRRAWYHTTGFGVSNRMLTVLNAADPREVIVIGLTETTAEQIRELVAIDAAEREHNPLDDVVEPAVERAFGVLIAEDDFSASGPIEYTPAVVGGIETDVAAVEREIAAAAPLLAVLQGGSRAAAVTLESRGPCDNADAGSLPPEPQAPPLTAPVLGHPSDLPDVVDRLGRECDNRPSQAHSSRGGVSGVA
jgi:hypothetical protein